MLVTEDMSIDEITKKFPQTSKVFVEYGLFCVGCAASSVESLKQGILGHGFTEEKFEEILDKLNEVAKLPAEEVLPKFEVTVDAAKKLSEIKKSNPNISSKRYLRISFSGEGSENFEFIDDKNEDDVIFFMEDLKIIIDRKSFESLTGYVVDYKNYDFGEGFAFEKL